MPSCSCSERAKQLCLLATGLFVVHLLLVLERSVPLIHVDSRTKDEEKENSKFARMLTGE